MSNDPNPSLTDMCDTLLEINKTVQSLPVGTHCTHCTQRSQI